MPRGGGMQVGPSWELTPWATQYQDIVDAERKTREDAALQAQKDAADMARQESVNANQRTLENMRQSGRLQELLKTNELNKASAAEEEQKGAASLKNVLSTVPEWRQKYGTETQPAIPAVAAVPEQPARPAVPSMSDQLRSGVGAPAEAIPGRAAIPAQPAQYAVTDQNALNLWRASQGKLGGELLKPPTPVAPQPFTLGKDQSRYDAAGNLVAEGPKSSESSNYLFPTGQAAHDDAIRNGFKNGEFSITNTEKGYKWTGAVAPAATRIAADIDPATFDMAIQQWVINGKAPAFGRSPALMVKFYERAKELFPDLDVARTQANAKGIQTEINKNATIRGAVEPMVESLDGQIDVATNLVRNLSQHDARFQNYAINTLRNQAGDPGVAEAAAQLLLIRTEAAKIITSLTGAGVVSDTARKEMESVMSENMSPSQLLAVLNRLKADGDIRLKSLEDQDAKAQARLKPIYKSGYTAPLTPPALKSPEEQKKDATYNKYNRGGR